MLKEMIKKIKLNNKIIISIALIIMTIFILTNNVFATFNPNAPKWNPNAYVKKGNFTAKAGVILGWIQFFGMLISVIVLAFIGLKYMLSSVEEKAEYKKTMIPYVVGCFMLMAISVIIEIIENIAKI